MRRKAFSLTNLTVASWLLVSLFAVLFTAAPAAQAQTTALSDVNSGRVRIAHMSPDAPAVDVYVDGNKALSNVPFKAVSDYVRLVAGDHMVEVRPTGAAADSKPVISAKVTIERGKDYTAAAVNELSKISAALFVDNTVAPELGKAKIRVIHASPDAPAVDVALKGGAVLIPNLAFNQASDILSVAAGRYNLEVRVAGTNTVALNLANTDLEGGKIYTIFAAGKLANLGVVPVVVSDTRTPITTGFVSVAHMSPDAPAVDVYVDGSKVLTNVPFKAVSAYLPVPAGERRFEVRPTGTAANTPAVIDAKVFIEANQDYTVMAYDKVAQIKAGLYREDNSFPGVNKAQVLVVHASPDAPAVDIALKNGPVLIKNLPFGQISDTLVVDAGTYDLEVRVAGSNTVVLSLPGTKLEASKAYTVFAADFAAKLTPVLDVLNLRCELPNWAVTAAKPKGVSALNQIDSRFNATYNRYDQVAAGQRTFVWGPAPFATGFEPYYQAKDTNGVNTQQRLTVYWDKSRMEISNAATDSNSLAFVTNGLLSVELITGKLQLGDNLGEAKQGVQCQPANVNVAGDPDDTKGPTYSALNARLSDAPLAVGKVVNQFIDRDGKLTTNNDLAQKYNVVGGYTESATKHTIAKPFWDFLNSGDFQLSADGKRGKLFDPYWYAPGFPITEAYWSKVKVGGVEKDVLIQAFERRVLTFTPSNPAGYQVEWGNVGQHYFNWRYGSQPGSPLVLTSN